MKRPIPEFKSEQEEADFWNSHSPLDFISEPTAQIVKTKARQDQLITIRLDTESLQKLEALAAQYNLGPSTFARFIILSALKGIKQKPYTTEELKAKAKEANFIKTLPGDDPRRQKFFDDILSRFIGSGPKGIYDALMKARKEERELETEQDKEQLEKR